MATKAEAIIGMVQRGEKWKPANWHSNHYVYYCDTEDRSGFKNDIAAEVSISRMSNDWELYTGPKKKVKMWQWLIKTGPGYYSNTTRFTAEAPLVNQNAKVIKKLDYTEIEVEVEE